MGNLFLTDEQIKDLEKAFGVRYINGKSKRYKKYKFFGEDNTIIIHKQDFTVEYYKCPHDFTHVEEYTPLTVDMIIKFARILGGDLCS